MRPVRSVLGAVMLSATLSNALTASGPRGPPARPGWFMSSRPCRPSQTRHVRSGAPNLRIVRLLNVAAARPDRSGGEQHETTSCRSSQTAKMTGAQASAPAQLLR